MSIEKTEALVLRTFDFRETSLIASFFTKDFGKIQGLLKGIREDPQKFASSVEPFSHNEIVFYRKKNTNLHLISACELKDGFTLLRSDMGKTLQASLMMELLDALTVWEDRNEELFLLTLDCLNRMNLSNNTDKIPTIYKIKALLLSGFKPHLDSCVSCAQRLNTQSRFSNSLGGLLCPQCFKKDIKASLIFRGTIASILYIERNDLDNALRLGINPQIKRELDYILTSFIEYHLEKKLKTQKVLPYLEDYLEKV